MLRVSFYSYKGGAGRSTTSWNTIQRLVTLMKPTEKEPFVIVDTDTESAGSTFLYKAKDAFFKDEEKQSVQRRMTDSEETNYFEASDSEKEEYFNGMYPIGRFFGLPLAEEKAVLLIGANLDKDSARDADVFGINCKDIKDSEQMKNFRKNIADACKDCGAKALFFDTPSGTQFLADRSIERSEIVVCCMRPTSQFREGTRGRLINFIKTDLKNKGRVKRKYILTPTVVCIDAGQKFFLDDEEYVYPSHAKEVIINYFMAENIEENDEIKQAYKENVIFDMLEPTPKENRIFANSEDNDSVFGIPEIKRFKWFEACLGKILTEGGKLTPNDEMAVNRYEYLARTILMYHKN
jgi:MinD-like ATPase involved in chromosome partitioning or flagellar assembly